MDKKFTVITGLGKNEQEYKVNGSTYVVSSRFQPLYKANFLKDRLKKIIADNFVPLKIFSSDDTIAVENVCSAVGKEDNIAVEKEST